MIKDLKQAKILYLVKTMDIGGAERITLNLCKYFQDKTRSISVASSGGIFVEQLESSGIKHIQLQTPPLLKNIIPLFFELIHILRNEDFTIVHCQHRIFTFLLQFVPNRKFVLLYTSHNSFTDLFQRLIFPDFATAVSKSIYNNIRSTSLINGKNIFLVNNGVDVPEYNTPTTSQITFGFIGRLIKEKGIFDLLESVKILASDKLNFRLIIKGKGELDEIEAFIEQNNLSGTISILPPSFDVEEIYKDINVLVLPTRFNEGLPLSILEAAARGILVVSADVGGVKDFIQNEKTGIMLDSLEPESIARALKDIILNFDRYSSIPDNALQKVKAEYSLGAMNKKYEDLYNRTLVSSRSE
jgi:glycosyltransferase involved in cell wall biosynthesis